MTLTDPKGWRAALQAMALECRAVRQGVGGGEHPAASRHLAIQAPQVKDVVADGFVKASEICTTAAAKAACTKNGVS